MRSMYAPWTVLPLLIQNQLWHEEKTSYLIVPEESLIV